MLTGGHGDKKLFTWDGLVEEIRFDYANDGCCCEPEDAEEIDIEIISEDE